MALRGHFEELRDSLRDGTSHEILVEDYLRRCRDTDRAFDSQAEVDFRCADVAVQTAIMRYIPHAQLSKRNNPSIFLTSTISRLRRIHRRHPELDPRGLVEWSRALVRAVELGDELGFCLLYTSPSPRDS